MTPKIPAKKVKLRGTSINMKPVQKGGAFKPAAPSSDSQQRNGASFPSGTQFPPPPPGVQLKSATLRFPNGQGPQPGMLASMAPATGQVRFQPGVISSPDQPQERDELLDLIGSRQSATTGPISRDEISQQESYQEPMEQDAIDISFVNESLQAYLDICEMTLREWTPIRIIDSIHILAKSLGLDVLSLALVDPDRPGKLLPVISRGYNNPPNAELSAIWESCVDSAGRGIDWKRLMDATAKPDAPLALWIPHEGLSKFGYAPVHDGKTIHGFLVVGAYDKSRISPIAAAFLEMLGGRLGLSVGLQRNRGEWPSAILKTVKTLRDCLSLQMGIVDMLRESAKLSPEELNSLLDNGTHSLSEGASVLDRLIEEAAGSKSGS